MVDGRQHFQDLHKGTSLPYLCLNMYTCYTSMHAWSKSPQFQDENLSPCGCLWNWPSWKNGKNPSFLPQDIQTILAYSDPPFNWINQNTLKPSYFIHHWSSFPETVSCANNNWRNIDLMNLAGFCRNCMAKWYHAGAKVHGPLAVSLAVFALFMFLELVFVASFGFVRVCFVFPSVWGLSFFKSKAFFKQNRSRLWGVPMQYEEACERVYGEPYADWKKKNQKKASSSAN